MKTPDSDLKVNRNVYPDAVICDRMRLIGPKCHYCYEKLYFLRRFNKISINLLPIKDFQWHSLTLRIFKDFTEVWEPWEHRLEMFYAQFNLVFSYFGFIFTWFGFHGPVKISISVALSKLQGYDNQQAMTNQQFSLDFFLVVIVYVVVLLPNFLIKLHFPNNVSSSIML